MVMFLLHWPLSSCCCSTPGPPHLSTMSICLNRLSACGSRRVAQWIIVAPRVQWPSILTNPNKNVKLTPPLFANTFSLASPKEPKVAWMVPMLTCKSRTNTHCVPESRLVHTRKNSCQSPSIRTVRETHKPTNFKVIIWKRVCEQLT